MSPDPIGFGDGPNVYIYVHCNPINFVDALGLGTGEPIDVSTDNNNKTITITVRVAFYTDIGWGDKTEVANAAKVASRLKGEVHNEWNNKGRGWQVVDASGTTWNLQVKADVMAVSEVVIKDKPFSGYQKVWVKPVDKGGGCAGVIAENQSVRNAGNNKFYDPNLAAGRTVMPPIGTALEGYVRQDISNRQLRHEFAHLLYLPDRYVNRVDPEVDYGFEDQIMGGLRDVQYKDGSTRRMDNIGLNTFNDLLGHYSQKGLLPSLQWNGPAGGLPSEADTSVSQIPIPDDPHSGRGEALWQNSLLPANRKRSTRDIEMEHGGSYDPSRRGSPGYE